MRKGKRRKGGTNLCESFEKLAEGPGDDIEGVICKLDKGIDGALGCGIALDDVEGMTRVDRELRERVSTGEGETRKGNTHLVLYPVNECLHVFLLRSCRSCRVGDGGGLGEAISETMVRVVALVGFRGALCEDWVSS